MINIYIYLESQKDAKQLVMGMMEEGLLAHASIDKDNHSFIKIDGKVKEETNFVITGQTKALLFTEILNYISKHQIENIKIYSLPITQCNENFAEIIRNNTKRV